MTIYYHYDIPNRLWVAQNLERPTQVRYDAQAILTVD